MGGLIVKQMLVHLNEIETKLDKKKISLVDKNNLISSVLANTKAIIFLSTPHLGSSIAKTMANFSFALFPSTEIVELSSNSNYLIDLNKKFLSLLDKSTLNSKILSVCENQPTHYFFNLYAKTVTESSANIGVGEFYVASNKDHLNVCKPADKNCFVYKKILDLITDLVRVENSKCKKCKLELDLIEQKNANFFFQYFNSFTNF
jgi:hypothetical protein